METKETGTRACWDRDEGVVDEARLIDRSRPDQYYVVDSTDPRYMAFGTIDHRGILSIDLRTKIGDQRSTVLRGAEQFDRILAHFRGRVTGIKGNWHFGTNLDEVNHLTAQGLSLQQAACLTWTGRRAAAAGFTEVVVLASSGTLAPSQSCRSSSHDRARPLKDQEQVERMWPHNQPLDPSEVAPEIVKRLRDMWRQGKSTAQLVRVLHDLGIEPVPIKICFQAAFHLEDYGDVMPIGGWFPDGGGELSEDQLHRLMAPRIEGARQAWDHPAATVERLQQTR